MDDTASKQQVLPRITNTLPDQATGRMLLIAAILGKQNPFRCTKLNHRTNIGNKAALADAESRIEAVRAAHGSERLADLDEKQPDRQFPLPDETQTAISKACRDYKSGQASAKECQRNIRFGGSRHGTSKVCK